MIADIDLLRHNGLLASISAEDLDLLRPALQAVEIRMHDIIEHRDETIPFAYFPESGILSVVATQGRARDIEVGLAGFEGMSGTALTLMDNQSPYRTVVQVPGQAFRISAADFLAAMERSTSFRFVMLRYTRAFHLQMGFTALCNGRSRLEERLARWLLMIHDRSDGDRMELTHEYMSVMLGVGRSGVTAALHFLEGKGVNRSTRGLVTVMNREGLIAEAINAYGGAEAEYGRLTGIDVKTRRDFRVTKG